MKNKVYWTQKDGKKIDIDEMSISHLRNTLKMIIRNISKSEERLFKNQDKDDRKFQLNGDIAQSSIDDEEDDWYNEVFNDVYRYDVD